MTHSCCHTFVPVLAALALAASARAQAPTEAAAGERAPATLALLVGVKDYAPGTGEEFAALEGPENDVARARKLLVERFRFDEAGIVTLVGKDATHAALVKAFHEHLIQRARPETRVVFWFSGHGSRIPDASKQDASPRDADQGPFDETLLAYDSRAVSATGSYDFTDDELHSLLAALPSEDVVVVTDCCHSGGVLRGGRQPGVREAGFGSAPLDRARIDAFWPPGVRFLEDDPSRDPPRHVVHLAACGAQEQAGELETPAGTFGTMTWFLTNALNSVDPRTSWAEVGAVVRARVAGRGTRPGQGIQVVGASGRAVFGGTARPVPDGYQVDRYGARGLLIGAGSLHGLGEKGELRLVGMDGKELGTANVRKVSPWTSNADWTGPGDPPAVPMRAVPKTLADAHPKLRVWLAAGVDAALLADCEIAVAATGDRASADYVLQRAGGGLELLDGRGERVRVMHDDRVDVQQHLRREHRYRSLWEGVAEPGRFRVGIAIEPATKEESVQKCIPLALLREVTPERGAFPGTIVGAAELDPDHRPSGGLVALRVTNESDEPLHIAILSVAENREVNVIHGKDANNVVAPRGSVRKLVWLGPAKGWPPDRSMVDRYVVVATPQYADFMAFESPEPVSTTRGEADRAPPFLRQALGGSATRGPELADRAWGIAFRDLQIVAPKVFAEAQK